MIELFQQLTPYFGPLSAILIVAVAILYTDSRKKDTEIERLRQERNTAVEKKDIDLKDIAMKKDEDLKIANDKLLEFGQKSTAALLEVKAAISENTKSNNQLAEAVYSILRSGK